MRVPSLHRQEEYRGAGSDRRIVPREDNAVGMRVGTKRGRERDELTNGNIMTDRSEDGVSYTVYCEGSDRRTARRRGRRGAPSRCAVHATGSAPTGKCLVEDDVTTSPTSTFWFYLGFMV